MPDRAVQIMEHAGNSENLSGLSASQLVIWAGQRLQPGEPLYNMILTFRIGGVVEAALFQRAFQALVDDCDALRTVIIDQAGTPRQRVLEAFTYEPAFIDMLATDDPQAALSAWLAEHRERAFDLGTCHFESALLRLGSRDYIWYLNQHHILTDATSVAILFERMQEFYTLARAGRLGEARPLPAFQDYVRQEAAEQSSMLRKRADAYWEERLSNPLQPSSFYRRVPANRSGRTERVTAPLGGPRSVALRALATHEEFRAFTVDLALFQILTTVLFTYLHRMTGNRELAIGTPSHNRASTALKQTAGLLIEIFPLQVEIGEQETFTSLYRKVATASHELLLNAAPGASGFKHHRAYDVVLNFITASFGDFAGMPTEAEWVHAGYGDRNHLLRLQVEDFGRGDAYGLYFDMNVDVFDTRERAWCAEHFIRVLDAFLDDPTQALERVTLLSPTDRDRLIVEFNANEAMEVPHETVVQLFERQVETDSDRIALIRGDTALSYGELNQRVNAVTYKLISRGARVGQSIGVAMPRSAEAVIAMFAVLKSGAAYLPLDPVYPAE